MTEFDLLLVDLDIVSFGPLELVEECGTPLSSDRLSADGSRATSRPTASLPASRLHRLPLASRESRAALQSLLKLPRPDSHS